MKKNASPPRPCVIRKAVIPAAGLGTRFLPASKAIPKELVPVVDKPVIQYVVEEAVASGITDVIIVLGKGKEAIATHFGRNTELEEALERKGRSEDAAAIRRIAELARFHYVTQETPKGLGDAVLCARDAVGDEPFAVLMGDTLIQAHTPVTRQLVEAYGRYRTSTIAVEEVVLENVSRYGVIRGRRLSEDGDDWSVEDMVEKPSVSEAPSRMAVCSRYVLTPDIFDKLARMPPGKGGEIQLTDALREQAWERPLHAVQVRVTRHDVGNAAGFIKANVLMGLERPGLREGVQRLL